MFERNNFKKSEKVLEDGVVTLEDEYLDILNSDKAVNYILEKFDKNNSVATYKINYGIVFIGIDVVLDNGERCVFRVNKMNKKVRII